MFKSTQLRVRVRVAHHWSSLSSAACRSSLVPVLLSTSLACGHSFSLLRGHEPRGFGAAGFGGGLVAL